jgi:hypothetical protein
MANNVLVPQGNGQWAVLSTTETGGVHTLNVTTFPANSSILYRQPNGEFVLLATVLSGGVHTLAVASA